MGIDYGYFAAADDEAAATALDLLNGPPWLRAFRRTASVAPPARTGVLGRLRRRSARQPEFVVMSGPAPSDEAMREEAAVEEPFDVFYTRAVDPVQLLTLQALLTGRTVLELLDAQPLDRLLAKHDDESRFVVALDDDLKHALSVATAEQFAEVVPAWSQTEEYAGAGWGDRDELVATLSEAAEHLSGLASRAVAAGHRLYLWVDI